MDEMKLRSINCQAMIEVSDAMCWDICDDMVIWLDGVMNSLDQDIVEYMEECYQKMMDNMIQALNEQKRDHTDYGAQLEELKTLESAVKEKLLDYE